MSKPFILADNQDITKAGILFLLNRMPGFTEPFEADNKKDLIQQLTAHPNAVVILDYTLFDIVSADELIILSERFNAAEWILFSDELSEEFMRRIVFSSDKFSMVMKECTKEEIEAALQYTIRSERFICNRITNLLLSKKTTAEKQEKVLTGTEQEILKLIALGKTTKEIASERISSMHTIITHRKNIFRKLAVNNVHEATKYALRAGIIDSAEYYI